MGATPGVVARRTAIDDHDVLVVSSDSGGLALIEMTSRAIGGGHSPNEAGGHAALRAKTERRAVRPRSSSGNTRDEPIN